MARKLLLALALPAVAASAAAQGVDPVPPEVLFDRLAPSVWTIETFDARNQPLAAGSGVVIAPNQVVTNCHVLAKAKRASVTRDNVRFGATLEFPDVERDLCILKVPNLDAPAVTIASAEGMKIGARVYAIGSPRGLDQTISDGLLSGVRKSASGDFTALQVTVPISPGSSGGGLFDNRGRLVGITSFQLKDGQNLNFAVPATWIHEVPERAKIAMAQPARAPASHATSAGGFAPGQVFEYELRDRTTNNVRTVSYRLDRIEGGKLVFNQGAYVEDETGKVLTNTAPIGGDFDVAMPPGGWVPADAKPGSSWKNRYRSGGAGQLVQMEIEARAIAEETLQVKGEEMKVLRVQFTGYTQRGSGANVSPPGRYQAMAWYSPELQRVVRFEAKTRGGVSTAAFWVDEQLQLVDVRKD